MIILNSSDQRKYQRIPAPGVGLVDVFIDVCKGNSKYVIRVGPSLLEDISAGGVSLQIDNAVGIGKVLYLRNKYVKYITGVRHCRPMEVGFRLGLEFLQNEEKR